MASGHGADLGLGTGLGGAPAAYDATRLDVWPPCGHRQRLAKGGAMGSPPPQQTPTLPQGPLLEAVQVGRWSQAVVADHSPLRGLPATSCQKLQAGAPYSTSAPPLYLFDPRLLVGRLVVKVLHDVAHCRSCNGSAASRCSRPCCHRAVAQRSSTTNILRWSHPATHCGRANTE